MSQVEVVAQRIQDVAAHRKSDRGRRQRNATDEEQLVAVDHEGMTRAAIGSYRICRFSLYESVHKWQATAALWPSTTSPRGCLRLLMQSRKLRACCSIRFPSAFTITLSLLISGFGGNASSLYPRAAFVSTGVNSKPPRVMSILPLVPYSSTPFVSMPAASVASKVHVQPPGYTN